MIISHAHKFIFVKTRKTAGTSIEIALSQFCGPDDVITPIFEEDEKVRAELGYRGPQNLDVAARFYSAADRVRSWLRRQPLRFYNHAPAAFIRRHVPRDTWDGYFKFSFERNPFDKAVSRYFWSTRDHEPRPPIADYLRSAPRALLSNWDTYAIDGRIAVDFVGRFETLAADLATVMRKIGLPEDVVIPRTKARFRQDKRHYREVLDPASRRMVERVCGHELRAFAYAWESPAPADTATRPMKTPAP